MLHKSRRRLASGLFRIPFPTEARAGEPAAGSLPLTLFASDDDPIPGPGLLSVNTKVPWGCLAFSLLAAGILLAIINRYWAVVFVIVGLIVIKSFYNDSSRRVADAIRDGMAAFQAARFKEASAAFGAALEIQPDAAGLHYLMGMSLSGEGKMDLALVELDKAAEMNHYMEFAWIRGRCLGILKRHDESAAELRRAAAFSEHPARLVVLEELATQLDFLEQGEQADSLRREIKRARDLPPPDFGSGFGN